jgi:major membrane immunogen (membrane-anchored lipoprotein)
MKYFLIVAVLFLTACGKSDPKPHDTLADAYAECYMEMTGWHSGPGGLAERNKLRSIEIKEEVCKAKVYGQEAE